MNTSFLNEISILWCQGTQVKNPAFVSQSQKSQCSCLLAFRPPQVPCFVSPMCQERQFHTELPFLCLHLRMLFAKSNLLIKLCITMRQLFALPYLQLQFDGVVDTGLLVCFHLFTIWVTFKSALQKCLLEKGHVQRLRHVFVTSQNNQKC